MADISLTEYAPFGSVGDIGIGALGTALLIFFLGILIASGIGYLIYWYINKKKYRHIIPLYKMVGNKPYRIAVYKAKDLPISRAGDTLWFVAGVKKYLAPATIQSAPNEYMHWEREDGEWINFEIDNLDEVQKRAGVKYIQQDMRAQKVATGNILEQRLINKSWFEKYKDILTHIIFYFMVCICMVIIFYQWSDIVERTSELVSKLDQIIQSSSPNSIVPVPEFIILMCSSLKKKYTQIKEKISKDGIL